MNSFEDKVAGVIYGTAYGDALGATIEKLTYEQIKDQYGTVKDIRTQWYKKEWPASERNNRMRGDGIITDDTLMTVALVEVYEELKRHIDAYDMGKEFVDNIVYKKRYIPEFSREATIQERLFYPEQYIFLRHTLANCEPREGGIGNMVNCGAAMYIAPVGIVNAGNPQAAYNEAILFALGHQSSYGLEAAAVLAGCVAKAMMPGVTYKEVIETGIQLAKDGTKEAIQAMIHKSEEIKDKRNDSDFVIKEFQKTIFPFSPMGDDVHRKREKLGKASNHYTPSRLFSIEELPFALAYLNLYEGDFNQSIVEAVNSGRDTDSIGVMIGVICGALYGEKLISEEDKKLLEERNQMKLKEISRAFADVAKTIITNDIEINNIQKTIF